MTRRFKRYERQPCHILTQAGYIAYDLIRSPRRRTMVINIEESGSVNVYAPRFVAIREIEKFLHERAEWVKKNIQYQKKRQEYIKSKKFADGQEFLFQGQKYLLEVVPSDTKRSRISFDGAKWQISVSNEISDLQAEEEIKKRLISWYKAQAKEIFGGRVFNYSRIMGVDPMDIAIRSQKRIWGSCDHRNKKISLNWQLIMAPLAVIDYVVVHELCHLFHANHGKRFWKKVEKYMPDYAKREKWLRDHSLDMKLPI